MNETNPMTTNPGSPDTDETSAITTSAITTSAGTPRRTPDLLSMAAGLGALGVAGTVLLGGLSWLPDLDGRWILATLALVVGLTLLIGSLRPTKR